jgi:hypothetical protein
MPAPSHSRLAPQTVPGGSYEHDPPRHDEHLALPHCVTSVHSTHEPLPLQNRPPPSVHAVPEATFVVTTLPFEHERDAHCVEAGASPLSGACTTLPEPSHTLFLQSPDVCVPAGVPFATYVKPQALPEHTAVRHAFEPEHCAFERHSTQLPLPLQ